LRTGNTTTAGPYESVAMLGHSIVAKRFSTARTTGRKDKGANSFVMLPHILLESVAIIMLSGRASKVLLFLCKQYKGKNNGDLQAAWSLLKAAGWKSRASLHLALTELEDAKLVIRTRQGGRNRCNLYALAWFPVDADAKLDHPWCKGTRTPPNEWRNGKSCTPLMGQLTPQVGQSAPSTPIPKHDYPTNGSVRPISATGLPH
jgi:hypothetical protein